MHSAPSQPPASGLGIALNLLLVLSDLGWLAFWTIVTFFINVLDHSHRRDAGMSDTVGLLAAVGAVPLVVSLGCAVVGLVSAVRGDRDRSLKLALAALLIGAVPGVLVVVFFAKVAGA
jgi:hypothetical protein